MVTDPVNQLKKNLKLLSLKVKTLEKSYLPITRERVSFKNSLINLLVY